MVWAVKDPTSGNLDRIQVVKGWTKSGQSFEKIFDVVWAGDRKPDKWTGVVPPIGSTVDIENATYTNTIGAVELKKLWTDPEFDPSLHAFYYARAGSDAALDRNANERLGVAPLTLCPRHGSGRAWSSPIFYAGHRGTPRINRVRPLRSEEGRGGAQRRAVEGLDRGEVDVARNAVTGDKYQIIYTASGKALRASLRHRPSPGT